MNQNVPWVEKYRPGRISEIVYHTEIVSILRECLRRNELNNMLFYGPPGSGKTSTILALAKEFFPRSIFHERVLELNASDERGIKVVREKVKKFAQNAVSSVHYEKNEQGNQPPPFKIIILDEADSMTSSAQSALRRTMEKYMHNTRFCIVCNYVTKIIDPITSRCSKHRFKALPTELIAKQIQFIASQEQVSILNDSILLLVKQCNGDLRNCINSVQTIARINDGTISDENVCDYLNVVNLSIFEKIVTLCKNKKDFVEFINHVKSLFVSNKVSANFFVPQLLDYLLTNFGAVFGEKPNNDRLMKIFDAFSQVDYNLLQKADETLQLNSLMVVLYQNI